eukprot:CAMPEP_0114152688 /NCGR_PEP_ID=MMETSP0043_2-20121206/23942_1 /TAXON_ID=464988 /ORGANISM="Hemiselmis andersenii, Strain CCMP644" /LENGTH=82 /DNA_ID=CAMNT_0001247647 /DNA_START=49 /DNA_END=294 /DNA_ORIENTATION=-
MIGKGPTHAVRCTLAVEAPLLTTSSPSNKKETGKTQMHSHGSTRAAAAAPKAAALRRLFVAAHEREVPHAAVVHVHVLSVLV